MIEQDILYLIIKLHKIQRAYMGLVDAKFVKVKQPRVCACCKRIIPKGMRTLTSSYPMDKKYNVTYRQAYDNNWVKDYKYVLVRQWLHKECVETVINDAARVEIKDTWYKRMHYTDIDLNTLDDEEALEVLNYFYAKGEVTPSEYKIMEDAIIDSIAFRDAMGIGQE